MWTFFVVDFDLIRDDIDSVLTIAPVMIYKSKVSAAVALMEHLTELWDEGKDEETETITPDIVWNRTDNPEWLEGYERASEMTVVLYEVKIEG